MKVIGLTGGIGSGKSTVSDYLRKKQIYIIDADAISREIVIPNSENSALDELVNAFGKSILNSDGSLNRKGLAAIVFNDKESKAKLDEIMLGKIIDIILERIELSKKNNLDKLVVDAPLLFEAGLDKYCDETWVVDASDEVRIQRVMQRDQATAEEVAARIKSQSSREEKISKGTHILENSTTLQDLYEQIEKII